MIYPSFDPAALLSGKGCRIVRRMLMENLSGDFHIPEKLHGRPDHAFHIVSIADGNKEHAEIDIMPVGVKPLL